MTTGQIVTGTWGQGAYYKARVWSGTDDPLAHKAWNRYTMTADTYSRSLTTGYRTSTGDALVPFFAYTPTYKLPEPLDSNLELKLLSKLTDDIRGHSFNLAVSAAEIGQTLGLILNTLNGLSGVVRGARAGNIAMVTRAFAAMTSGKELSTVAKSTVKARDISGTVLATYYGWIPLFSDISEAMNAYAARMNAPRSIRFKRRVTGPVEYATLVNPGVYGASNPANKIHWRGNRSVKLEVEFQETLSFARSLGLCDPLSVLWEKTPWSFVFDWFIPIGTYFDNLGVLPFLKLKYIRSDFARANYRSWSGHSWIENGYTFQGGDIFGRTVSLERTTGTSLSVPLPSLKTVSEAFSLPHIRNAAALIHQAIASGKKVS